MKESKAFPEGGEQNSHEVAVRNPYSWRTIKWQHRCWMVQIRARVNEYRQVSRTRLPKALLAGTKTDCRTLRCGA